MAVLPTLPGEVYCKAGVASSPMVAQSRHVNSSDAWQHRLERFATRSKSSRVRVVRLCAAGNACLTKAHVASASSALIATFPRMAGMREQIERSVESAGAKSYQRAVNEVRVESIATDFSWKGEALLHYQGLIFAQGCWRLNHRNLEG